MSQAYKKMRLRLPLLNKFILVFLFLTACSTAKIVHVENRLTDREVMYEKGLSLFNSAKYLESSAFFLKLSQNSANENDELYNLSLWNLSLIYEKFNEFDKAALALEELERRQSTKLSLFKIQLGLMKNYIRLDNKKVALEIKKVIDTSTPTESYGVNEIYFSLAENVSFNFDQLMIEELKFLGEIQKYFIFVMESKNPKLSDKATDLLMTLYSSFFVALEKDTFNNVFKKALAIELLEQLRRFDYYKLDTFEIKQKNIKTFSLFSTDKQKYLTDWLHHDAY